ncbi:MAG TPA: prolyl oligopeptidase family serine peptidase, partial [Caulobacteraceae bacterium]|nr:prolyl oligopeptidase family serine peptidase [Caulobacteraceae bacterium]
AGYGEGFHDAGYGQLGRKIETDISDGVSTLAARGVIDAKRVCIVGSGLGGYSALAGVTLQQGLYRCAVSIEGVTNLAELIDGSKVNSHGANDTTRDLQALVGVKSIFGTHLADLSPARQAAKADAPIQLIYKTAEPGLTSGQSEEMAAALHRAGKPVETVVLPVDGDASEIEASRITTIKAVVAFVEKYNPPNPAPATQAKN